MKHDLDFEDGNYTVYMNPSKEDTIFIEQLALRYLIGNSMFPFYRLTPKTYCNLMESPDRIM
ncbi:MAG TPA: hypothetical protein PKA15_09900 [Chitinophagales bacterium]|jgi:hypothetical protein|nr:hypothetical protein [Chitinophagales bacterium]HMY41954.1 hypothetical protein [Chitinophagales bacterium]